MTTASIRTAPNAKLLNARLADHQAVIAERGSRTFHFTSRGQVLASGSFDYVRGVIADLADEDA